MHKNVLVIGFAGRAGVGKSWAAEEVAERLADEFPSEPSLRVYRYSFAGPLKALFAYLRPDLRLEDKNRVPAVREGLQRLGTALRSAFPAAPTTGALLSFVHELPDDGLNVVLVDDVRFTDEVLAIQRDLAGYVLGISGEGSLTGRAAQHESERSNLPGVGYLPDSPTAAVAAFAVVCRAMRSPSFGSGEPWLDEDVMYELADLAVSVFCCSWTTADAVLLALGQAPAQDLAEFSVDEAAHAALREAVERGASWAAPLLAAATQIRRK